MKEGKTFINLKSAPFIALCIETGDMASEELMQRMIEAELVCAPMPRDNKWTLGEKA